jgi:hypothetical protein
LRGEGGDYLDEQCVCSFTVVPAEVADIDVERDSADLGPGVHRQVRLGEDYGAGHAGWLAGCIAESMEEAADYGQTVTFAGRYAECLEARRIKQEARGAAAIVEVGEEMESMHG